MERLSNPNKDAAEYQDVMEYYDFGVAGNEIDESDSFYPGDDGGEMGLEQWVVSRFGVNESRPGVNEVNSRLQDALADNPNLVHSGGRVEEIQYVDQIKPFNVTINFLNEAGSAAKMSIIDLEIMNEGSGVSIQDLATSQNYTWVARDIQEMHAVDPYTGSPIDSPKDHGSASDMDDNLDHGMRRA